MFTQNTLNLTFRTLISHLQNSIALCYKTLNCTLWKEVIASSSYHPMSGWKSVCTLSRRRRSLGSGQDHSQPHYHCRCQSFYSFLYQVLMLQSLPKWRDLKFAYISILLTVNLAPLLFLMFPRNKKTQPDTVARFEPWTQKTRSRSAVRSISTFYVTSYDTSMFQIHIEPPPPPPPPPR